MGDNLRCSHFTDAEREAQGLKNTQVAGSHLGGPGSPSWSPSSCLLTPIIVFLSWEALQALVCVEALRATPKSSPTRRVPSREHRVSWHSFV